MKLKKHKERITWIDALKGWLIILVVLGHSVGGEGVVMSQINRMLSSFLMPAFMAVSDWLFYTHISSNISTVTCRSYLSSIIRRSQQLIIPLLIWSLLILLLRGNYSFESAFDIIYRPDRYFWFLWVLFCITVIFGGAQKIAAKLKIDEMIAILSVCMILFGIMVSLELRVFGFQFLAYYFIFYVLGYCIHKYENKLRSLRNPWILFILFIFWLFLAWFWQMHALPVWVPKIPHVPSTLLQYLYRGITGFLAVVIILTTAPSVLNGKNKFNQTICLIGDISLGLYVAHLTIVGFIQDTVHSISDNMYVKIIAIFTLTFIFSLLIILLLKKNKYSARLFLGKIK